MPTTYEPIATTTLSSSAASITFSSIASSWTDLRLVITATTFTTNALIMRFNNDSGTNYSVTTIYGNGSSAGSLRSTNDNQIILAGTAANTSTTIPCLLTADIFSYAGSTNKTVLTTGNLDQNGSGAREDSVGLWRNTSAITRIDILPLSGTIKAASTATLYGIKNA